MEVQTPLWYGDETAENLAEPQGRNRMVDGLVEPHTLRNCPRGPFVRLENQALLLANIAIPLSFECPDTNGHLQECLGQRIVYHSLYGTLFERTQKEAARVMEEYGSDPLFDRDHDSDLTDQSLF